MPHKAIDMSKRTNLVKKSNVPDRQPMLMIVCGETGVGKTYRTVFEIEQYIKDDKKTGKKGRKVLIFERSVASDHM